MDSSSSTFGKRDHNLQLVDSLLTCCTCAAWGDMKIKLLGCRLSLPLIPPLLRKVRMAMDNIYGHSSPFKAPSSFMTRPVFVAALFLVACILSIPIPAWQNAGRRINAYRNPLSWSIPPLEQVTMHIIPASVHFEMGADAWDHLLPPSGHTVHLTESDGSIKTYTVTMFHQLRCVEVLQRAYADEGSHRTPIAQHCLNYLRQTFMCGMDMRNEPQGTSFTWNGAENLCRDWEPILEEAERNHKAYRSR